MTGALDRVSRTVLPLSLLAIAALAGRRGRPAALPGLPARAPAPAPASGASPAADAVPVPALLPEPIGGGSPGGPASLLDLAGRLVGHEVLVSVRDRSDPLSGTLAAFLDELLILSAGTHLVYIDAADVTAIRTGSSGHRQARGGCRKGRVRRQPRFGGAGEEYEDEDDAYLPPGPEAAGSPFAGGHDDNDGGGHDGWHGGNHGAGHDRWHGGDHGGGHDGGHDRGPGAGGRPAASGDCPDGDGADGRPAAGARAPEGQPESPRREAYPVITSPRCQGWQLIHIYRPHG